MKEVKDYNPSKDPRLIDCKTECGNDKCYARRYGLFAEKTCPNFVKPKPITNADRIRSMTDEELAKFCFLITDDVASYYGGDGYESKYPVAPKAWLEWLRQEANDVGQ